MSIKLFDTTLRDGTQREGVSLTTEDKIRIARELDSLGLHYIEAGFPTSNPKDLEFFENFDTAELANACPATRRTCGGRPGCHPSPPSLRSRSLHRRQELEATCREGPAHHPRGEPRVREGHGGVPRGSG